MTDLLDPVSQLRLRRKPRGISAVLLPLLSPSEIDWPSFRRHVERTAEVGIEPAINMDTGYGNLLDDSTKRTVLKEVQTVLAGRPFVAGAFVGDQPGAAFNLTGYCQQIDMIQSCGGVPVIFQSFGLTGQSDDDLIASYEAIGRHSGQFIGFELGTMFAPFGAIYSLDVYRRMMGIKACIGAKHSSLNRSLEWQRLQLRDCTRPDFHVFTGNDLAIDMIMYGSDYLLGLSSFAPDLFAKRDALWAAGNADFYELNDVLQYLGFFAFRNPVPAYKHTAAMFLKLRGWITTSLTHPKSATRPESDLPILQDILRQLAPYSETR